MGPGTAGGSHHQGRAGGQSGSIAAFGTGGKADAPKDFKKIQIAGLDGTAGTQCHIQPRLYGGQHRGGGSAGLGGSEGAGNGSDLLLAQKRPIRIGEASAVGGGYRQMENAVAVQ